MKKIYTALPEFIDYEPVTQLINLIESEKEDSEVTWNGRGGFTAASQIMMAYLQSTDKTVHSDTAGLAASANAFLIPFFKYSKGANQADIMIHSVAGGEESTQNHTNKLMYDTWANKIDLDKFKELTGKTLKQVLFSNERIDVWLTGKQCGQNGIKLFDETYDLSKAASLTSNIELDKLGYELPEEIKNKYFKKAKIVKSNINSMEIKDVTAEMLQSGNKVAYDVIFNAGKAAHEAAEKVRIAEIKKYAKYDNDKAFEMIEKGATLQPADVEHFIEKKYDTSKVAELEEGSEGELKPGKKVVEPKVTKEAETVNEEKSAILAEAGFDVTDKK